MGIVNNLISKQNSLENKVANLENDLNSVKANVNNLETSIGKIESNTNEIKGMVVTEAKMTQMIAAALGSFKKG